MANEKEPVQKFLEMLQIFKSKADELNTEILGTFNNNLTAVLMNYTELQNTYGKGYTGIAVSAQKANETLLESFDKNYGVLKQNMETLQVETKKKADVAIDESLTDLQAQCEEILKKFPALPRNAHKEIIQTISQNKDKVTGEIDKKYKDLVEKLDSNFSATRKQLTMPAIRGYKFPPLDINSMGLMDAAKNTAKLVMNNLPGAVQNLAANIPIPGSSKK